MKKLIFTFVLSLFSLGFAKIENIKDDGTNEIKIDLIQKNFIELSRAKASTLKNIAMKSFVASSIGLSLFYIYSEAFGAISKRNGWGHSYTSKSGYETWSYSETIFHPKHIVLGLSIASCGAALAYFRFSKDILGQYQQEELRKIIDQWDSNKNLVDPKFRNLLNCISTIYKRNPTEVDFSEVAKKLKLLIENNKD